MSKIDEYRAQLRGLDDWEPFLLCESRLPGPRANLELVDAVAEEGDAARFRRLIALGDEPAPADRPVEYLALCGLLGLGRLLAEGDRSVLPELRAAAADPRWRVREGVAIALQRFGKRDMPGLLGEMADWSKGSLLERRAAVGALCEPPLLGKNEETRQVLAILDQITASIAGAANRKSDEFVVLRKALAYGWSVVVAAYPAAGKPAMERWFASQDKDIRAIMRENLKKQRLVRMDAAWTEHWLAQLD